MENNAILKVQNIGMDEEAESQCARQCPLRACGLLRIWEQVTFSKKR